MTVAEFTNQLRTSHVIILDQGSKVRFGDANIASGLSELLTAMFAPDAIISALEAEQNTWWLAIGQSAVHLQISRDGLVINLQLEQFHGADIINPPRLDVRYSEASHPVSIREARLHAKIGVRQISREARGDDAAGIVLFARDLMRVHAQGGRR
jgi:hypothetical protein